MITGKQRSYLRKLGQSLEPVVYIGKADLTENVLKEIDTLLSSRELIKVKLQEGSLLDPKVCANDAAQILGAEPVQVIGRRFVLYRQAEDPEKRTIVLPR